MKITTDKAFSKFLMYYNRAVVNPVIEKPISWALYHTWKYFDEHEKPNKWKEIKHEKKGE